ncbi:MAG: NAD(P)H-dependent oxidoreductase [Spirochaetota bacterium]
MLAYQDLIDLDSQGRCIKVGLVGAGFMGKGITEVLESAPGMKVVAVADIDLKRAEECYRAINFDTYRVVQDLQQAKKLTFPHQRLATSSHRLVPQLDDIDMVVEATGVPEVGAEVAYLGITNRKHVGMLNVETDATVGRYLHSLACQAGVVYTVCSGDEPAALKELCDFARTLGFTIVACGKGKNNPLDHQANPHTMQALARQKGLNPKILTEFVDGTKTMVEMGVTANATGLSIDRTNMHGPRVNLDQLVSVFAPVEEGGILHHTGVVDYAIGDVAPGVFVVVEHHGNLVNSTLQYLRIGEGPRYLLYRPYHLTNLEVPVSIAWAFLYHKPVLPPLPRPCTEVITIAKKDLEKGELIDSIGGFTVYGGLEKSAAAAGGSFLPIGVAEGARVVQDIPAGSRITWDQVEVRDSLLLQLRKVQDRFG